MQAPRVSVRTQALTPQLRPPVRPQLRHVFDTFHFEGEPPMAARAQVKPDFDGPEDRQLADDIARVMHHRPLMSHLARVETAHGEAAGFVAKSATRLAPNLPAPAAAETLPPPISADPRSLEEVIDDLDHVATTPPGATWLDTARREHRRERMRNAMAWVTTFAIAGSIVAVAFFLLRA